MSQTRRAVAVTSHKHAELVELPANNAALGDLEVAGTTLATLISAGTELAWCYTAESGFPFYAGYAAVFRIDRVGAGVTRFQPGDIVFAMGSHQSEQRASERDCLPVPAGLDPADAVFARLIGVSMSTLTTTTARPPARVLVTGLGPVGYLAAASFARCGYRVDAFDPIASRRHLASMLTGVRALDEIPAPTSPDDQYQLVVECSGHEAAVLAACKAVAKRGEVVLVGVPWKRKADIQAFDVLHAVFHKYVVLRSGWEWEVPVHAEEFKPGSMLGNMAAAMEWINDDSVPIVGIYKTVKPGDCQEAYASLAAGTAETLAVVFAWT